MPYPDELDTFVDPITLTPLSVGSQTQIIKALNRAAAALEAHLGFGGTTPFLGTQAVGTDDKQTRWDRLGRYYLGMWGELPTSDNAADAMVRQAMTDISGFQYETDKGSWTSDATNDEWVQGGILELPTKMLWRAEQIVVPSHVKVNGLGAQGPRGAGDKGGYSGPRFKATESLNQSMFLVPRNAVGNGFNGFSIDLNRGHLTEDNPVVLAAMHGIEEEFCKYRVTGVTGVASTDVITVTAHGLRDGDRVIFNPLVDGAGLKQGVNYYVRNSTTNTMQVSATPTGAIIDFTTNIASGTIALLWAANVHASYTRYTDLLIENYPGIGLKTSPIHLNPVIEGVICAKGGVGGAYIGCTDADISNSVFANNSDQPDSYGLWTPFGLLGMLNVVRYRNGVNMRTDQDPALVAAGYNNIAFEIRSALGYSTLADYEGLILAAGTRRTTWTGESWNSNSNKSWGGAKPFTGVTGDAATNIFTLAAHGFVADDPLSFSSHSGPMTSITDGTLYFVLADGLDADHFKLSAAPSGPEIDFATDLTLGVGSAKGVTGVASTNVLTAIDHRLLIGDRVFFASKTGGAGITVGTLYYATEVSAGSYAAGTAISTPDTFKMAATLADALTGTPVDFTTDLTVGVLGISRPHVRVDSSDMDSHEFAAPRSADVVNGGRPSHFIEHSPVGTSVVQVLGGYDSGEVKIARFSDKTKIMSMVAGVRHFFAAANPTGGLKSGDKVYRTDLHAWFEYNGVSWDAELPSDAELIALAGLVSAANKLPYFTGLGTAALADLTAAGRALIDDADAAAQRTTLGLAIGTNVQAYDAELAALAGLTSAADSFPYFTGSGTAALQSIAAAIRTVLASADLVAFRLNAGVVANINGGLEVLYAGGNTSTAVTIDLANGNIQAFTVNGNCTFTMPSAALVNGRAPSFTVILTDSGGPRTITFTGVKWHAGLDPTVMSGANAIDIYSFVSDGTSWYGFIGGQGMAT